jgi:hypothetical protein
MKHELGIEQRVLGRQPPTKCEPPGAIAVVSDQSTNWSFRVEQANGRFGENPPFEMRSICASGLDQSA